MTDFLTAAKILRSLAYKVLEEVDGPKDLATNPLYRTKASAEDLRHGCPSASWTSRVFAPGESEPIRARGKMLNDIADAFELVEQEVQGAKQT